MERLTRGIKFKLFSTDPGCISKILEFSCVFSHILLFVVYTGKNSSVEIKKLKLKIFTGLVLKETNVHNLSLLLHKTTINQQHYFLLFIIHRNNFSQTNGPHAINPAAIIAVAKLIQIILKNNLIQLLITSTTYHPNLLLLNNNSSA